MTETHLGMSLNVVTLLLTGGALGVILNYRHKMRELDINKEAQDGSAQRVNFDTITSELRRQLDAAIRHSQAQDKRVEQLEAEITGLRIARDLDPFPNWIVGAADYSYIYVNREFEQVFLRPDGKAYRDLIGKKHEDFWPEEFCRTLYALNNSAKARPDGTARATTTLEIPAVGEAQVTVHKFPVRAQPSGAIVGWAGYITGIDPAGRQIG